MWQCSQQHENRDEAKFCAKCGEKHETRPRCTQCASPLEPGDVFCTSCGHPQAAQPKVDAPVVESAVPVAVAAPTPPSSPPEPEPVTFSFGGATIEMKDDPSKPDRIVKPSTGNSGMSPAVTTALSFALIAAVLWIAFYLITR